MEDLQDKIETDDEVPALPLLLTCFAETLVNLSKILLVQMISVRNSCSLTAVADSRKEDTHLAWTVSDVHRTDVDGGEVRSEKLRASGM